jgi:3-dehydroquinate synthase
VQSYSPVPLLTQFSRTVEYDFTFLDGVFDPQNKQLADCYQRWGRALAVMDLNIYNLYGEQMQKYFDHHKLELKIHKTMIGEKAKSMDTLLSIVDSMTDFGIIRKEPVLVVVCGRSCVVFCRGTNALAGRRTRHRRCWVKLCHWSIA